LKKKEEIETGLEDLVVRIYTLDKMEESATNKRLGFIFIAVVLECIFAFILPIPRLFGIIFTVLVIAGTILVHLFFLTDLNFVEDELEKVTEDLLEYIALHPEDEKLLEKYFQEDDEEDF